MLNKYEDQVSCVDLNRKVEVYRNLHKDCWSVRQKGIVRFHCHKIHLRNCEFVVQPAGRARVLREKKKNVHAFIRGYLCREERIVNTFCWDDIYYNPYTADTFVSYDGVPVLKADNVDLDVTDRSTPVLALNPE